MRLLWVVAVSLLASAAVVIGSEESETDQQVAVAGSNEDLLSRGRREAWNSKWTRTLKLKSLDGDSSEVIYPPSRPQRRPLPPPRPPHQEDYKPEAEPQVWPRYQANEYGQTVQVGPDTPSPPPRRQLKQLSTRSRTTVRRPNTNTGGWQAHGEVRRPAPTRPPLPPPSSTGHQPLKYGDYVMYHYVESGVWEREAGGVVTGLVKTPDQLVQQLIRDKNKVGWYVLYYWNGVMWQIFDGNNDGRPVGTARPQRLPPPTSRPRPQVRAGNSDDQWQSHRSVLGRGSNRVEARVVKVDDSAEETNWPGPLKLGDHILYHYDDGHWHKLVSTKGVGGPTKTPDQIINEHILRPKRTGRYVLYYWNRQWNTYEGSVSEAPEAPAPAPAAPRLRLKSGDSVQYGQTQWVRHPLSNVKESSESEELRPYVDPILQAQTISSYVGGVRI